jgi:hypothetical protein
VRLYSGFTSLPSLGRSAKLLVLVPVAGVADTLFVVRQLCLQCRSLFPGFLRGQKFCSCSVCAVLFGVHRDLVLEMKEVSNGCRVHPNSLRKLGLGYIFLALVDEETVENCVGSFVIGFHGADLDARLEGGSLRCLRGPAIKTVEGDAPAYAAASCSRGTERSCSSLSVEKGGTPLSPDNWWVTCLQNSCSSTSPS